MERSGLHQGRRLQQTAHLIELGHQAGGQAPQVALRSALALDQPQGVQPREQIARDRPADAVMRGHRHLDDLVAAERHAGDEIALHAVPDLLPFAAATDEIEGVLGYLELRPLPAAEARRAADDIAARAVARQQPFLLEPLQGPSHRHAAQRQFLRQPVFGQGRARRQPAGFDVAAHQPADHGVQRHVVERGDVIRIHAAWSDSWR